MSRHVAQAREAGSQTFTDQRKRCKKRSRTPSIDTLDIFALREGERNLADSAVNQLHAPPVWDLKSRTKSTHSRTEQPQHRGTGEVHRTDRELSHSDAGASRSPSSSLSVDVVGLGSRKKPRKAVSGTMSRTRNETAKLDVSSVHGLGHGRRTPATSMLPTPTLPQPVQRSRVSAASLSCAVPAVSATGRGLSSQSTSGPRNSSPDGTATTRRSRIAAVEVIDLADEDEAEPGRACISGDSQVVEVLEEASDESCMLSDDSGLPRKSPSSHCRSDHPQHREPDACEPSAVPGGSSSVKLEAGPQKRARASQYSSDDPVVVERVAPVDEQPRAIHRTRVCSPPGRQTLGGTAPQDHARSSTSNRSHAFAPKPISTIQFYSSPARKSLSRDRGSMLSSAAASCTRDPRLVPPTPNELALIKGVTFKAPMTAVVASIPSVNLKLRGKDIARLRGRRWLNDEVLNAFISLVNARNAQAFRSVDMHQSERWRLSRPRTYVFNTFFYTRLMCPGYDYNGVKRWPRRANVDIASLDLVLVPINIDNFHWVLAAVDARRRRFVYFDSMCNPDSTKVLKNLRRWYCDELSATKGAAALARLSISSWADVENPAWLPQQRDSGSCGVYSMYLADYLELGKLPKFTDEHVTVLRQKAILFLITGRLPDA